jgi:hypothetical protein
MITGIFKKFVEKSSGINSKIIYDEIDDSRIKEAIIRLNGN